MMKKNTLLGLLALFLLLSGCQQAEGEKRMLLVVPAEMPEVSRVAEKSGLQPLARAAQAQGVHLDSCFSLRFLKEENLRKYRALVFLKDPNEQLNDFQRTDLKRFIEAGGGLMVVQQKNPKGPLERRGVGNLALVYPRDLKDPNRLEAHVTQVMGTLDYEEAETPRLPDPSRFSKDILHQRFDEPMELAVMSNGNILIVERKGAVKIYDAFERKIKTINHLSVHHEEEDGLLGLALDPDFDNNHWLYLFYSPAGEEAVQHVSRFEFQDSILVESEKVLLSIPVQREECCHSAGSLEFGPKGYLWISVGDNTNPFEAHGYAPIDERPGRSAWDAQRSSANTMDLRGKILRIQPEADGTYSIPEGNLFPPGSGKGRPEIYVMGCRNPFRFSIDPRTYFLYWGDIGPDANFDSLGRGPRGHDEFNQARKPGFFGWPYFVSDNKAYHDATFVRGSGRSAKDVVVEGSEKAFHPEHPINESPNNTGARELPPAQPAFISYPYGPSDSFPMLGAGSRNAMAGPAYYSADFRSPGAFPAYYDGKILFYDWMRGWIFWVHTDSTGNLERLERFVPDMRFSNLMDMEFGKNGSLYILEYGTGWFLENADARLARITYHPGNRPPEVTIRADQVTGPAPLEVRFSSRVLDPDGDELSYRWWFDGAAPQSSAAHPTFTFEKPGRYQVMLKVEDEQGKTTDAFVEIQVGNEAPQMSWSFSDHQGYGGNESFWWPDLPFAYHLTLSDREDGKLGEGILPEQVTLTYDYLEQTQDLSLLAQGHQSEADSRTVAQLIEASNCSSCHQMEEKLVGPGFRQVADRYRNQEGAEAYLVNKILNGGGGVWGAQPMAAQAQLSQGEARQIARYLLALGEDQVVNKLPPEGIFRPESRPNAYLLLQASYTDRGGEQADPIRVSKRLKLIPNGMLEAAAFDEASDVIPKQFSQDKTPYVNNLRNGSWLMFKDLDLSSLQALRFVWRNGQIPEAGTIEVRLDSRQGPLWGSKTFSDKEAGPWISLPPNQGRHDLYILIRTSGEEIGSLDGIQFRPGKMKM
jgi:cytochrome c